MNSVTLRTRDGHTVIVRCDPAGRIAITHSNFTSKAETAAFVDFRTMRRPDYKVGGGLVLQGRCYALTWEETRQIQEAIQQLQHS